MKKEKIIGILEDFKPDSGDYCRASYEEFVNEKVSSRLDDIIKFIKREPDDDWIKCTEKMPDDMQYVLFYSTDDGSVWAGWYYKEFGEFFFGNGKWQPERYVTHWMPLPKIPKEDN